MSEKDGRVSLALVALMLVVSAAVYLPGISGPYIFDDHTSIIANSYLRITSLDPRELYHASFSVASGPLIRPISMLSFALNYYFAGSFEDTTPLKLTNLFVHIFNGLLVFWLMRLVFARLFVITETSTGKAEAVGGLSRSSLLAAAVSLLWIVHPINLTSVLYVVQRMASLSALFTLLGLICYLKGRNRAVAGRIGGVWLVAMGLIAFGALGVFSKENAALLPVFMMALEFILFAREKPWPAWARLSTRTRVALLVGAMAVVIAVFSWVVAYSLPRYEWRSFTLMERLLTECRVLFFYLSLILVPRINELGLHHDDIVISSSLFSPWTTFVSLLGIVGLLVLAGFQRRKLPLLSLGILWFFIGHLIESTIVPLEIAHEHRNYLASLGIVFAIVYLLEQAFRRFGLKKLWALYAVLVVGFAGTTLLRAAQWSDHNNLIRYEALHHPNSARAQLVLSSLLYRQGQYEQAMEAVRRAVALAPEEPGHRINMQLLAIRQGIVLEPSVQAETLRLLATKPPSPTTQLALESVAQCMANDCRELQEPMETWLNTLIENLPPSTDRSYLYYLLGLTLIAQDKVLDGLNTLERAHRLDPRYLHPLFGLANVFLQLRQLKNAEFMLERLRKANENNPHPKDKEIAELAAAIETLRSELERQSPDES